MPCCHVLPRSPHVEQGNGRERRHCRTSAWQPDAYADWDLRQDRDCGAAGRAFSGRWRDDGTEERSAAGLSAPHPGRRCADREHVTDTHRVRLALNALFGGTVSKDMVSRVWRTVEERLG